VSDLAAEIEAVLLEEATILRRVGELAACISEDYRGKNLLIVGLLRGAFVFLADLVRRLTIPVEVDFLQAVSYGSGTVSSGQVRLLKDLETSVQGRDVLVVEDIVDTGLTLRYTLDTLGARNPASLRACALLDKPERRQVAVPIDYVGFTIPDRFVVGYGLDFAQKYRNLPFVGILKEQASARSLERYRHP